MKLNPSFFIFSFFLTFVRPSRSAFSVFNMQLRQQRYFADLMFRAETEAVVPTNPI